jgi:hypothetical protein
MPRVAHVPVALRSPDDPMARGLQYHVFTFFA